MRPQVLTQATPPTALRSLTAGSGNKNNALTEPCLHEWGQGIVFVVRCFCAEAVGIYMLFVRTTPRSKVLEGQGKFFQKVPLRGLGQRPIKTHHITQLSERKRPLQEQQKRHLPALACAFLFALRSLLLCSCHTS